jgi:hypothetical protein
MTSFCTLQALIGRVPFKRSKHVSDESKFVTLPGLPAMRRDPWINQDDVPLALDVRAFVVHAGEPAIASHPAARTAASPRRMELPDVGSQRW